MAFQTLVELGCLRAKDYQERSKLVKETLTQIQLGTVDPQYDLNYLRERFKNRRDQNELTALNNARDRYVHQLVRDRRFNMGDIYLLTAMIAPVNEQQSLSAYLDYAKSLRHGLNQPLFRNYSDFMLSPVFNSH